MCVCSSMNMRAFFSSSSLSCFLYSSSSHCISAMEKCHSKPTVQAGLMEFPDPKNLTSLKILLLKSIRFLLSNEVDE